MDLETDQEDRYCGSEEMSKVEIGGTQNKKISPDVKGCFTGAQQVANIVGGDQIRQKMWKLNYS